MSAGAGTGGPIDPRLLRRSRATRGYLLLLVVLGTAQAGLLIVQAWMLASAVAGLIGGDPVSSHLSSLLVLAVTLAVRGVLTGAQDWAGHRAAAAVKSTLRRDLAQARLARPFADDASAGRLVALGTHGVEALDAWFAGYLPQLVLAIVVPAVVGGGILLADPTSGLIVALTVPLIPAFMVLVGLATRDRLASRWRARARLAHHVTDLLRGLPTLQVFGRARAQVEGLRRTEERHVEATVGTLRVAFLSALVLEALATLSVALVAVVIGLRVVEGDLGLTVALFVLVLAPEVYLPLRQVGARFHDAADGTAAAREAFDLVDAPPPRTEVTPTALQHTTAPPPRPEVTPTALRHATRRGFEDRSAVGVTSVPPLILAVDADLGEPGATRAAGVDLTVRRGEVVALVGPSGSGKSSLFTALLGHLPVSAGRIELDGVPWGDVDLAAWRRRVAWVGQHPVLRPGTIGEHLRLGAAAATPAQMRAALDTVGARTLEPTRVIAADGTGLSAGERRRVDLARALLSVSPTPAPDDDGTPGRDLLLLDEPSADLDADAEAAVIDAVRAAGCTVLVITHRPAVLAAADRVVTLSAASRTTPAHPRSTDATTSRPSDDSSEAAARDDPSSPVPVPADPRAATPTWLQPTRWHPRALAGISTAASIGSALTAVGLTATSGWLLARAAEHPPVLHLLVAVVAVRALGLGRAALRYLERLTSHVLGLRHAAALRVRLLAALAPMPLGGRARGEDLSRLVDDADAAQDSVVRVRLPLLAAGVVSLMAVVAFTVWAPWAGLVLAGHALLAGLLWPWWAARVSARSDARIAVLRGALAAQLLAVHEQAALLHTTGREACGLRDLARADAAVRDAERRAASARGLGQAAAFLTLALTVPLVLLAGLEQVRDGALAPLMLAVLALTPLALHEVLAPLTQAFQVSRRTASARARVDALTRQTRTVTNGDAHDVLDPDVDHDTAREPGVESAPGIRTHDLVVGRGSETLTAPLDLTVEPGDRVVVTGPSGVGKSTLLATLLGSVPELSGTTRIRGRVGVLTQDAHVFDTTVAENLRIGDPRATDAALHSALDAVGLDLPLTRMVGEHGHAVSGGEARRIALARVLLTRPEVVLLDEPTEHLDRDTALALLRDIDRLWPAAPILIVSHQPGLVREVWPHVREQPLARWQPVRDLVAIG